MKTTQTSEITKVQKKRKKIRIITIAVILFALLIVLYLYANSTDFVSTNSAPKETPIHLEDEGSSLEGKVQAKSRDEIVDALEKQQLVVTDKLSSNITFSSGKTGTIGEWIVENPAENNIIQQAEVYLDELLIAKSTAIYPNQHIEAIELLEEITSGEYDVIAYVNYYDIDTKEYISKAGYTIHLTVQ